MADKNLLTYLQSQGKKMDSIDICLDWNTPNGEWISDSYDIEPFTEKLKIFYIYKQNNKQVIDIQDSKGNVHMGFSPNSFRPHNKYLNRDFVRYMKSSKN